MQLKMEYFEIEVTPPKLKKRKPQEEFKENKTQDSTLNHFSSSHEGSISITSSFGGCTKYELGEAGVFQQKRKKSGISSILQVESLEIDVTPSATAETSCSRLEEVLPVVRPSRKFMEVPKSVLKATAMKDNTSLIRKSKVGSSKLASLRNIRSETSLEIHQINMEDDDEGIKRQKPEIRAEVSSEPQPTCNNSSDFIHALKESIQEFLKNGKEPQQNKDERSQHESLVLLESLAELNLTDLCKASQKKLVIQTFNVKELLSNIIVPGPDFVKRNKNVNTKANEGLIMEETLEEAISGKSSGTSTSHSLEVGNQVTSYKENSPQLLSTAQMMNPQNYEELLRSFKKYQDNFWETALELPKHLEETQNKATNCGFENGKQYHTSNGKNDDFNEDVADLKATFPFEDIQENKIKQTALNQNEAETRYSDLKSTRHVQRDFTRTYATKTKHQKPKRDSMENETEETLVNRHTIYQNYMVLTNTGGSPQESEKAHRVEDVQSHKDTLNLLCKCIQVFEDLLREDELCHEKYTMEVYEKRIAQLSHEFDQLEKASSRNANENDVISVHDQDEPSEDIWSNDKIRKLACKCTELLKRLIEERKASQCECKNSRISHSSQIVAASEKMLQDEFSGSISIQSDKSVVIDHQPCEKSENKNDETWICKCIDTLEEGGRCSCKKEEDTDGSNTINSNEEEEESAIEKESSTDYNQPAEDVMSKDEEVPRNEELTTIKTKDNSSENLEERDDYFNDSKQQNHHLDNSKLNEYLENQKRADDEISTSQSLKITDSKNQIKDKCMCVTLFKKFLEEFVQHGCPHAEAGTVISRKSSNSSKILKEKCIKPAFVEKVSSGSSKANSIFRRSSLSSGSSKRSLKLPSPKASSTKRSSISEKASLSPPASLLERKKVSDSSTEIKALSQKPLPLEEEQVPSVSSKDEPVETGNPSKSSLPSNQSSVSTNLCGCNRKLQTIRPTTTYSGTDKTSLLTEGKAASLKKIDSASKSSQGSLKSIGSKTGRCKPESLGSKMSSLASLRNSPNVKDEATSVSIGRTFQKLGTKDESISVQTFGKNVGELKERSSSSESKTSLQNSFEHRSYKSGQYLISATSAQENANGRKTSSLSSSPKSFRRRSHNSGQHLTSTTPSQEKASTKQDGESGSKTSSSSSSQKSFDRRSHISSQDHTSAISLQENATIKYKDEDKTGSKTLSLSSSPKSFKRRSRNGGQNLISATPSQESASTKHKEEHEIGSKTSSLSLLQKSFDHSSHKSSHDVISTTSLQEESSKNEELEKINDSEDSVTTIEIVLSQHENRELQDEQESVTSCSTIQSESSTSHEEEKMKEKESEIMEEDDEKQQKHNRRESNQEDEIRRTFGKRKQQLEPQNDETEIEVQTLIESDESRLQEEKDATKSRKTSPTRKRDEPGKKISRNEIQSRKARSKITPIKSNTSTDQDEETKRPCFIDAFRPRNRSKSRSKSPDTNLFSWLDRIFVKPEPCNRQNCRYWNRAEDEAGSSMSGRKKSRSGRQQSRYSSSSKDRNNGSDLRSRWKHEGNEEEESGRRSKVSKQQKGICHKENCRYYVRNVMEQHCRVDDVTGKAFRGVSYKNEPKNELQANSMQVRLAPIELRDYTPAFSSNNIQHSLTDKNKKFIGLENSQVVSIFENNTTIEKERKISASTLNTQMFYEEIYSESQSVQRNTQLTDFMVILNISSQKNCPPTSCMKNVLHASTSICKKLTYKMEEANFKHFQCPQCSLLLKTNSIAKLNSFTVTHSVGDVNNVQCRCFSKQVCDNHRNEDFSSTCSTLSCGSYKSGSSNKILCKLEKEPERVNLQYYFSRRADQVPKCTSSVYPEPTHCSSSSFEKNYQLPNGPTREKSIYFVQEAQSHFTNAVSKSLHTNKIKLLMEVPLGPVLERKVFRDTFCGLEELDSTFRSTEVNEDFGESLNGSKTKTGTWSKLQGEEEFATNQPKATDCKVNNHNYEFFDHENTNGSSSGKLTGSSDPKIVSLLSSYIQENQNVFY